MAEDTAETPVDIPSITEQVLGTAAKYVGLDTIVDAVVGSDLKKTVARAKSLEHILAELGELGGKAIVALEEPILPVFASMIAPIAANMFGADFDAELFSNRGNVAGRRHGAEGIVDVFIGSILGAGGAQLEPSDEGAKRVATAGVHAALEGWFNAWILEMLGDLVPWEWLKFKDMTRLPEELIRSLGVGRLVRRAIGPIIDVKATTPLQWKMHREYRPTLLAASTAVRQFYRGNWDYSDVAEELARQGYSDERINALINEQRKFQSVSDVRELVTRGEWTSLQGQQHLQDQGYDQDGAQLALRVEGLKRIEQQENSIASSLVAAFANRDIDDATFQQTLVATIGPESERALITELAQVRRALNTKRLTLSQVEQCVKAGILAVDDYRNTARLEGYNEADVLSLELLLRAEQARDIEIAQHRADALEARAAEQKAKADAAAKRLAEVEAERALRRRGSFAELSRAYVRGLIPETRLEEVLNAEYDADTVSILVGLANDDRQKYLAQQKQAADATKTAARRNIDVGALETAVLENVLTVDQFRARLEALNFAPADVDVLSATVAAKLADKQAAAQKRAAADKAAADKHIDLGRFEQLVRRGVRTMADYELLLEQLGFDVASRAAMRQLLELKIADDAAAAKHRATFGAGSQVKGLTLEQLRRAVLLGLKQPSDYETFLVENNFTADAVAVLMGELADDVTQADAARARRAAAEGASGSASLSLSVLARAARLGIVDPATYQRRLVDRGYSPDDVAIEMDLLVQEIADTQATRAKAAAPATPAGSPTLSLSQLARAVRAGVKTLEDYRAGAIEAGYAAEDVDALVRTLADELETSRAAKARKDAIAGVLESQHISIGVLDDQVRAGTLTLDAYVQQLERAGIAVDDAELLASLLADDVGGLG